MSDVKEGPRPDDTAPMTQPLQTLSRPPRDVRDPARWSVVLRRIGVFWPVFGATLVVAVIFVATVAYSSMNDVGAPGTVGEDVVRPAVRPSSFRILQVASTTTPQAAQASAARLRSGGFPGANVLRSELYRPLNPGYYVVFAGTYPLTKDGRAVAEADQKRLPAALRGDSRIREIHQR